MELVTYILSPVRWITAAIASVEPPVAQAVRWVVVVDMVNSTSVRDTCHVTNVLAEHETLAEKDRQSCASPANSWPQSGGVGSLRGRGHRSWNILVNAGVQMCQRAARTLGAETSHCEFARYIQVRLILLLSGAPEIHRSSWSGNRRDCSRRDLFARVDRGKHGRLNFACNP